MACTAIKGDASAVEKRCRTDGGKAMKKATLVLLAAVVTFLGVEATGFGSTMPPNPICKNQNAVRFQPCRSPRPLPPQPIRKSR